MRTGQRELGMSTSDGKRRSASIGKRLHPLTKEVLWLQPALVQPANDCRREPDRIGHGPEVDVVRYIGRPVVVGRLLQVGARAQRRALVPRAERVDAIGRVPQAEIWIEADP